mgnify:FL=1
MNPERKKTKKERGQAIMFVAIAFVGLIGIIGLMIDVGTLFLESSRLKRSIDAAAVAASLEFREGITPLPGVQPLDHPSFINATKEFVLLNIDDVQLDDDDKDGNGSIEQDEGEEGIHTYTCDLTKVVSEPDNYAGLCPDPTPSDPSDNHLYASGDFFRKLIRVRATKLVNFNFLPVIGIEGTTITTDAVGEAASVDIVLIIDASTSMADQTDPANGGKDFTICNHSVISNPYTDGCQPFETIKAYAKDFANQLLYPYDRVSVISFDRLAHNVTVANNGWEYDASQVHNTIDSLLVYNDDLPLCINERPGAGLCGSYDANGNFSKPCPHWEDTGGLSGGDAASCTSSNVGGGLKLANFQFTRDLREEALWVIVLLASGPANAISPTLTHPLGYCPPGTSNPLPVIAGFQQPLCRDDQAGVRHAPGSIDYDGDDYARDMADDIIADGQGAVIYTIGYGGDGGFARHRLDPYDKDIAEQLLIYIATEAGTVDDLGLYISAPTNAELVEAFKKIAENIATKISQ